MSLRDQVLDQLPLIVGFTLAVGFLLLVVHLGVAQLAWDEAGYVLLLALVSLAVLLAIDGARKAAFRREVARRIGVGEEAAAAPLPKPASREQRALTELLARQNAAAARWRAGLERRAEEHRAFVDVWVHQMKTPLNVIQLASTRRDPEAWDDVAEEAGRLAHGLDLMLAAARLERFELDLTPTEMDLVTLVKGVANELRSTFIGAGVYPRVQSGGREVRAVTDAKWFQVVVRQLLSNAVKYSPADATVVARLSTTDGGVELSVTDVGAGIPAEDLPRVFDRFFTGANGRRFGASTGMGLHIAAEVCRRLGHELVIESAVGSGTTATVRLRGAGIHRLEERPDSQVTEP